MDAATIVAVVVATTHLREVVLHAAVGAPIVVEVMAAKLADTAKIVVAVKAVAQVTIVDRGEDEATEVDEAVRVSRVRLLRNIPPATRTQTRPRAGVKMLLVNID